LIEAGFSPPQAVQILSANGAKVIGVDRELGTVEPGKIADLVVIDGDPVANPMDFDKAQLVFKGGIGYDSAKLIAAVKGLVGVR
jgi:imidazolonepropionase-like amidohydrolase